MFSIVALVVLVPVAGLLAYAASRPNTFRYQRVTTIEAPPEVILPFVEDFRRWSSWSPYEKLDPAMERTYEGAPTGKGAAYTWTGNAKAGAGRMEILDASPSKVVIQLDFSKPFVAHNVAEFTFEPRDGATRVTWAMHGPTPFMSKLMGVFIDMDAMIGKDFESGLQSLKAAAEAQA